MKPVDTSMMEKCPMEESQPVEKNRTSSPARAASQKIVRRSFEERLGIRVSRRDNSHIYSCTLYASLSRPRSAGASADPATSRYRFAN